MKIAVISPFFNEPLDWIEQCKASVAQQTVACDHFFIGDSPRSKVPAPATVIDLPVSVNDFGNTPRAVGSMYAAGLGYEAIAFLDADNMYEPQHIETLVRLHQKSGAAVVTSRRKFIRLDGSYMAECLTSDGQNFCDTNCLFFTRPAFHMLAQWSFMGKMFSHIGDRVLWQLIRQSGLTTAHTNEATVLYRATHEGFYRDLGELAPEGVKRSTDSNIPFALAQWEKLGHPSLRLVHTYTKYRSPTTGNDT